MESANAHHQGIRDQFAQRIATYEAAARWMTHPRLIEAQRNAAGHARPGSDKCLDLCCGTGIVGRSLLDLGWKVQGLDLTPEMASVANRYFPAAVGSVESIPFASASFDLATLRQSFMLVDGEKTLREVHRVLKPGGRLILIQSVSFSDADDEIYERVQWARHIHMRTYYRADNLVAALESAGFRMEARTSFPIEESVDHWLKSAPELKPELRAEIRGLINEAPASYKDTRHVREENGELFENWNWLVLTGKKVR